MISSAAWLCGFAFFVFLAGLFGGSETGMYQLSRVRLRLGIEKRRMTFVLLGRVMRDSSGLLLTLLIGTNLAHYVGTSIMTGLLLPSVEGEHTAEILTTVLTAPILFVFSEMIPKNFFFYRADYLMPRLAPVLYGVHKVFVWCGAVPVLRFISIFFGRLVGLTASSRTVITSAQRHHVRVILQETREEGILSSVQAEIIDRIATVPTIQIKSVMIALSKVRTADVNSDGSALLEKLREDAFTRLPVFEGRPANIIGFVNIYEALSLPGQLRDLRGVLQPIERLAANTTVIEAIEFMQKENEKIVLVTAGGARAGREIPLGIVTMKDLVEELLGELAEW